ncbi:MAG: ABC transporter permease [Anaerolineae bacterium]|nr:ABC transporter permease [Anaerolineae bacterium]
MKVVWKRFRKHRLAMVGASILLIFVLAALIAPILAPRVPQGSGLTKVGLLHDPLAVDPANKHLTPGADGHILGTDEVGRDVFARLLYAAQVSLYVGIMAMLGSEIIGALLGAISGYYSDSAIDSLLMRLTDFMLTLPLLPILLVLSALLASIAPSPFARLNYLIIILIIFGWMSPARLVRGVVLSLRQQEFTEASRALGASDLRIILHHMLPNAMAPIIVSSTLAVGDYIIVEAALSFLGFGVPAPLASWGNMLTSVQDYMFMNPTLAIWPGLCIFLTVLSINFMGDGLRDALDPRMRGRGTAG